MIGKSVYLISQEFIYDAHNIAMDLGLSRNEWIFVPFNKSKREDILLGRRISSEKYLIGYFSEMERKYLLK